MSENSNIQEDEVDKRLRESRGVSTAYKEVLKVHPNSTVFLMGPSAPCDLLVVDGEQGKIVAVEVKASKPSSKGNRRLSKPQKEIRNAS